MLEEMKDGIGRIGALDMERIADILYEKIVQIDPRYEPIVKRIVSILRGRKQFYAEHYSCIIKSLENFYSTGNYSETNHVSDSCASDSEFTGDDEVGMPPTKRKHSKIVYNDLSGSSSESNNDFQTSFFFNQSPQPKKQKYSNTIGNGPTSSFGKS